MLWIGADISMLPTPYHRQQIVCIALPEISFEKTHRVLDRGKAHLAVLSLAKEVLREQPTCVHPTKGSQSLDRRSLIPTVCKCPVGQKSGFHPFEEQVIVRGGACRAAQRGNRSHHVGVQSAPLVGLLCAHRIADDQQNSFDL